MKYYRLLAFFIFTVIYTKVCAQDFTCKDAHAIASMELQANTAKFNNGLFSKASKNFTVHYYRCEWGIDPAVYYIAGKVTPYFTITATTNKIVFDLAHQLTVDSIYLHGLKINFSQDVSDILTVKFAAQFAAGHKDSVSIFYHGKPAGGGFGSFTQTTHGNNVPVIWTLSEPYGAKDWWPCRNGLDDKADSIDVYVTYPSVYRASSNGLLVSRKVTNSTAVSHYRHSYPIASYLVAIAVTNFSVFTDHVQLGTVSLPVISYIYPEDLNGFKNANYIVLRALKLYNNTFADYPFINERYGQTEFSWGGGMEHQTNSFVVGTGENLMTHELAHQWFGDKITCASWRDIWLNEGFATYISGIVYNEKFNPSSVQSNVENELNYIVSSPNGSVWVDDTTNVNRIFDGRLSYDKGSFLLRMLRWTMGDSLFFKGLQQYQQDPKLKYGFAYTADLQRNLEAVSGLKLNYFFNQWFYGQGYPSFTVKWSQDANKKVTFSISQVTSDASVSFFKAPLQLVIKNGVKEKKVVVFTQINNQQADVQLGFVADTVLIDPDHQLISGKNKSIHQTLALDIMMSSSDVQTYPNPVTDKLSVNIKSLGVQEFRAVLYNSAGEKVWSQTFSGAKSMQSFTVPFTAMPRGIYLLHITTDDGKTIERKIIK